MMIHRGTNIAKVMMVTVAYRFAGFMLSPMSMPIERLERVVRMDAARLNPTAWPKETHCRAVRRGEWCTTQGSYIFRPFGLNS